VTASALSPSQFAVPARLHSGTAPASAKGSRGSTAPGSGPEAAKDSDGIETPVFPSLLDDLIGGDGQPEAKPEAKQFKKAARKLLLLAIQVGVQAKEEDTAKLSPVALFSGSAGEPAERPVAAAGEEEALISEAAPGAVSRPEPLVLAAGLQASGAVGLDWGKLLVSAVAPAKPATPATPPASQAGNQASTVEEAPTDWTALLDMAVAQVQPAPIHTGGSKQSKATAASAPEIPELHARTSSDAAVQPSGASVPVTIAPLPMPEAYVAPEAAAPAQQSSPLPAVPQAGWPDPAETSHLAFTAHLVPMTESDKPAGPGTPEQAPLVPAGSAGKPAVPAAAQPAGPATDQQHDNPPSGGQESKDAAPERLRKAEAPQPAGAEGPMTGGKPAQMPVAPQPQADGGSIQPSGSSGSNPLRPKDPVEPALEQTPAPGAAREIRLEVNGGDQRVEVRLVERGGEVHVAVRAPDAHLAEALREDLPGLSSRLAESGFRTETWRPGAAGGGEWHRQAEPPAGGSLQDSNGQPRQNGREQHPGDPPPGRPKAPAEQLNRKEKGKDFEWFMSTLR
jgi:hypothetical protein